MIVLTLDEAYDLIKSRTRGARDKQKRKVAPSKQMTFWEEQEEKKNPSKKYNKGDYVWAKIGDKDHKARVILHGGRRVVVRMHKKYEGKMLKKYTVDQDSVKLRERLKKDLTTENLES
jgi:hypothetical protein